MRNPEQTRNHIIELASPIFNKNGYAGTSLSDILEQTYLTKGAIYHHFENKDDLAMAVLEYNLKIVSDINYNEIKKHTHSCDRLIAFAEAFKKNYDLMRQMGGCPVMNAAVDSDDGNELIKKRVSKFIRQWEKTIHTIIKQGKLNKEIRADLNADEFAMNFISVFEGSMAMSKVTDDKKFVESAVDMIIGLIHNIRA